VQSETWFQRHQVLTGHKAFQDLSVLHFLTALWTEHIDVTNIAEPVCKDWCPATPENCEAQWYDTYSALFQILYFLYFIIIALLIALHIDFPLLGIVSNHSTITSLYYLLFVICAAP
jgi:hypothetical protein